MSAPARYVTEDKHAERNRYVLLRLCECVSCGATGKTDDGSRCPECRGEGRTRQEICTCDSPESLGVALVTLAREGEWEGCPIGIRDDMGEKGERWLVRPWLPSARNISDAGRTLRQAQTKGG